MFRLFYILENCISKYIKKGQMQRGIAAENCGYAFFMCAWRRTFLMGASSESARQWEGYSRKQGCPCEGNLKEAGCGNRLTTGKSLV